MEEEWVYRAIGSDRAWVLAAQGLFDMICEEKISDAKSKERKARRKELSALDLRRADHTVLTQRY
jgi:hypothetical protein